MAVNKALYRELCGKEKTIPVFLRDWWLDAACGSGNWDVILAGENGEITAAMPYYTVKRFGLKYIVQPRLTPKSGIWLKYPAKQKPSQRLSFEKRIINEVINRLESTGKLCYFEQCFDYTVTNWLPFYWKGFRQTTCYTYVIESLADLDRVFTEFDHSKRKNIKRAAQLVHVKTGLSACDFYVSHKKTLEKQGKTISYDFETFRNIYEAACARDCGKSFYAEDDEGNIHAAIFMVWDEVSAYYLISSIDPDYRNSGASSLLVWEAVKHASVKTTRFDFEGSMIEEVENSFRKFGAVQVPYSNIWKEYRMLAGCKSLLLLARRIGRNVAGLRKRMVLKCCTSILRIKKMQTG